MTARCLELIVVDESRGAGVVGDPVRTVQAVYAKDGAKVAENDPLAPIYWSAALNVPGGFQLHESTKLRVEERSGFNLTHLSFHTEAELVELVDRKGPAWTLVNAHREAVASLLRAIDAEDPVDDDELKRLVAAVKVCDRALGEAPSS